MSSLQVARAATTAGAVLAASVTLPAAIYLGVLTIAAAPAARPTKPSDRTRRFAVLMAAHDEAAVIGRALAAFKGVDYPADKFDMHVVADNCTDETAALVRAAGFQAHERVDPANPGKGAALNWLFDIVDCAHDPADAYVVVDADTTVDPGFLAAVDAAMSNGATVVQGYYGVRDPDRSTAAGLRYAALACRHHLRPLGRNRLGASSGLYGNGMAFDRSVLHGRRWSGHLVEDAEFQMELLFDDCLVTYAPDARLHAEMPDTLAAAATQNSRWEQGRMQLVRRYAAPLLRRSIDPTARHRLAAADALFDQLVPPLSVVATGQLVAVGAAALARAMNPSRVARAALVLATIGVTTTIAHVVIALRAVRAPRPVYRALISAPRAILWKVGLWRRMVRSDEVDWVRTERNADARLDFEGIVE